MISIWHEFFLKFIAMQLLLLKLAIVKFHVLEHGISKSEFWQYPPTPPKSFAARRNFWRQISGSGVRTRRAGVSGHPNSARISGFSGSQKSGISVGVPEKWNFGVFSGHKKNTCFSGSGGVLKGLPSVLGGPEGYFFGRKSSVQQPSRRGKGKKRFLRARGLFFVFTPKKVVFRTRMKQFNRRKPSKKVVFTPIPESPVFHRSVNLNPPPSLM